MTDQIWCIGHIFVFIDYLGIVFFPKIGATNFSFDFPPLSLDDSESLGDYSSYLAIFLFLFAVTESLHIERFNLFALCTSKSALVGLSQSEIIEYSRLI